MSKTKTQLALEAEAENKTQFKATCKKCGPDQLHYVNKLECVNCKAIRNKRYTNLKKGKSA
ncbi:hypothetical protein HCY58_11550 [Acinetobacter radioresistens]|uniref:hypothetical protein n=1 Tax=Acinetobacter radioresistens TaxID=40216 RepID=UPI00200646CE|nr:hypothetical protein [Acinetobacter radioresistens]MCK4087681.1 hypothetical protein [Acinetobacter radioresistens]MCK4093534.1 hypothetical protein [Acinetobacter radioresistens]